MIVKELADYLAGKSLGTVGSDIFIGDFPVEDTSGNGIQAGVYLIASHGEGQDEYLNIRYEQVDFWGVSTLYETAYNKLKSIHEELSRGLNYRDWQEGMEVEG